jgi:regulatory protein
VAETVVVPGEGRITACEPYPRRAGAVRVEVDGRPRWTVPADTLDGVGPGVRLDAALSDRLEAAADIEAALRTMLRALARRAFARHDLGRRTIKRGHPAAAVEGALDRLHQMGLLDDLKFARGYAETRAARGRGPARIARDLGAMGVDRGLVDRVLADRTDDSALEDQARALARKRAPQLEGLDRPARRRRLLAYLARRGFTGSVARGVVKEVVG